MSDTAQTASGEPISFARMSIVLASSQPRHRSVPRFDAVLFFFWVAYLGTVSAGVYWIVTG